jgi:hypothetical protein
MGAQSAYAGVIPCLECSVRFDVGANDERLNEVTGFAIGAGLVKPRENDDDGLAIDGGWTIVNNQAVGVHVVDSNQIPSATSVPSASPNTAANA